MDLYRKRLPASVPSNTRPGRACGCEKCTDGEVPCRRACRINVYRRREEAGEEIFSERDYRDPESELPSGADLLGVLHRIGGRDEDLAPPLSKKRETRKVTPCLS